MKKILKYAVVFFATLLFLIILLILSCTIPRGDIRENSQISADYINESEGSFYRPLIKDRFAVDNYADSIWLSIAFGVDSEHPIKSAFAGGYYNEFEDGYYNISFLEKQVEGDFEPNTNYSRYWHGILIFLRPLLTAFDYMEIRYLNLIFLSGLALILIILLQKKAGTAMAAIFGTALICVNFFVVPFSLEFVPMFVIMFISSIIATHMAAKDDRQKFLYLMLITGICASFFDFLTTETITLCVPLVIFLYIMYKGDKLKGFKDGIVFIVKSGVLWGIGYAVTWGLKWILSSMVLKTNVFDSVKSSIAERTAENVNSSLGAQLINSLISNIQALFPFNFLTNIYAIIGVMLIIVLVVGGFWIAYKKPVKGMYFPLLLLLIGLVPYARFIVLSNHSYIHSWFTFRAQLTSIICFMLAFVLSIDWQRIKNDWHKITKNKPSK